MKTRILEILHQADFSKDFTQYISEIFPSTYQMQFHRPYHEDLAENPINDLARKEALIESLAQLLDLKAYYTKRGISLRHFYDSIVDLNFRVGRYNRKYGLYGLTKWDIRWLSPLYRGEIFDLGSLRFQISGFSYREIEREDYQYMHLSKKWKAQFPEGTPIITIHILQDTDFQPEKVDESLTIAREFFQKYFQDHAYEYFVSRTWLIYPPTRDILSTKSNIASFSKRFKVIAKNQNAKQALDRIYGTNDLASIQKMAKHSSLEKTAYKHLDKLGVAAGIIRR